MERPPMERALSTDVVMDIVMSHLKVKDLLSCRKVSKFWNKAASSVLRRRSTAVRNIICRSDLIELQECIATSSDFPYTGLSFSRPWLLQSAGAMRFLENHGARFTSLYLGTSYKTRLQDIAPILHRLPRLSSLEMGWSNLVPPPAESSDSAAGQEDGRILSLPSLCTLRMFHRLNLEVLREVCTAASPSLRIECPKTSYGILRALKTVGKLQAVSVLKVDGDKDKEVYALRVNKLLSTETPALTKLDFENGGYISRKGLMKLLISSQHTLKELRLAEICPSEFLFECPVLNKLTKLSVSIMESDKYLFQGSHGHKFPALTELKLNFGSEIRISDGLFIVPAVTRLDFEGVIGTEDHMNKLAQTFPNVVEIGLDFDFYHSLEDLGEYVGSAPSDIWSVRKFKQLEKLRIRKFWVRPSHKFVENMDSFLTGIPLSICRNMHQKPELILSLIMAPFGESFSEVLRVDPSLLQLKNLKELVICVQLEDGLEELPEDPPFMSMVSVWFALQMMRNLEAKFVYDHSWLSREFTAENRDKAVTMLKAAFKHVHPHVKLEPFFY